MHTSTDLRPWEQRESLRPIMVAMCAWGAENVKGAPAKVDFAPVEPPQFGHAQARKGAYSNERL
jgi:hypothetical protein